MNLPEAALIAGLIQAPDTHSPFFDYQKAKKRQKFVLDRMAALGWITEKEAAIAYKTSLKIGTAKDIEREGSCIFITQIVPNAAIKKPIINLIFPEIPFELLL